MPYRAGFSDEDYLRLRDAIVRFAGYGSFSANEALFPLAKSGITNNPDEIASMLQDLTDLQVLVELGGEPPRWELAPD